MCKISCSAMIELYKITRILPTIRDETSYIKKLYLAWGRLSLYKGVPEEIKRIDSRKRLGLTHPLHKDTFFKVFS